MEENLKEVIREIVDNHHCEKCECATSDIDNTDETTEKIWDLIKDIIK